MNKVKISEYYLPLLKNITKDAKLTSHQYCLKAGLIRQCGSGIYTWLPLGLKIIQNIENIVREEFNKLGLIEILMPCIQQAEIWKQSERYESYGKEMLKFLDRNNHEMLFGPTNEELVTNLMKGEINSYKQLPKIFYHTQWKFRDEIRPRFGLLRAREFLMNDAYSFDVDKENAKISYDKMYKLYLNVFKALGLKIIPCKSNAGAIGGDLNHEFHLICKSGESKIFYDENIAKLQEKFYKNLENSNEIIEQLQNTYSVTEEIHQEEKKDVISANSIEVGHIFYFGTKYSSKMGAKILNKDGSLSQIHMGSYGIGVSRLVAAIIEANYTEKNGMIWPEEISPFKIGLINLHEESKDIAEKIYQKYSSIIYDDTLDSVGVKFSRLDLTGVQKYAIIGRRSLVNGKFELKDRISGETTLLDVT